MRELLPSMPASMNGPPRSVGEGGGREGPTAPFPQVVVAPASTAA
ncbi:hypothetical protein [Micromonospora sp. NPDC047740]